MKTILERFHSFVADQYTAVDVEADYAASLNESYDFNKVGGPFADMTPSTVLEAVDPTAYRCGLVDHQDYMSRENAYVEINEELYHRDDVESAKEEFIAELRSDDADEWEISEAEAIEF